MAARAKVLSAFKELHRTCQSVYAGNRKALRASRWKINTEFKRFKDESRPNKIEDHIHLARNASRLVRLTAEEGTAVERQTYPTDVYQQERKSSSWQSEERPWKNFQTHNRYGNNANKDFRDRHYTKRRMDYDDAWSSDYPRYTNRGANKDRYTQSRRVDDDNDPWGSDYPHYNNRANGDRHFAQTRRMDDDDDAWSSDYPRYTSHGAKPWHKKKPSHVDSANFDLSKMTGKKR